jgi:amino acid permease
VSAALGSLPAPFWLLGLVPVVLAVLLWKFLVSAALVALAGWALVAHSGSDLMVFAAVLALASAAALLLSTRYRSARVRPFRLHRQEVAR